MLPSGQISVASSVTLKMSELPDVDSSRGYIYYNNWCCVCGIIFIHAVVCLYKFLIVNKSYDCLIRNHFGNGIFCVLLIGCGIFFYNSLVTMHQHFGIIHHFN